MMNTNRCNLALYLLSFCLATIHSCGLVRATLESTDRDSVLQKIGSIPIDNGHVELFFVTGKDGWLANSKKLWRTNDSGETWELVYTGEPDWDISVRIENLQFLNGQTGWMSDAVKGIYKTDDGGKTWKSWGQPFPDGAIHTVKILRDGMEAWAAGIVNSPAPKHYSSRVLRPDRYAAISHSTDGGKTWQRQVVIGTLAIDSLYFGNDMAGWGLGLPGLFVQNNKRWLKAHLRGGSCSGQMLLDTLGRKSGVESEPAALFFLDQSHGWLSFKNGYLAKTTDGGRTWCDLLNPRDVWPNQRWDTFFWKIHFLDAFKGWAIGFDCLYQTEDGGSTWRKADGPTHFNDMYFLNTRDAWAVSKDGIYRIKP